MESVWYLKIFRMKQALWLMFVLATACCQATTVIRETRLGKVRGNLVEVRHAMVEEFKSIPFAEPPVGNRRFKEPVPKASWNGTLNATGEGSICHQILNSVFFKSSEQFTEDCLHLNIWAPANAAKSAVFVWMHGGGFTYGTATTKTIDARLLAAMTGFVVVAINYRLGLLGFLNGNSPDAPGNQGLLDQNLALKWVQENIDFFGGDPSRVTIIGQSAGSMSVHAHILSPMSRGLFTRAIMLSGSLTSVDFFDTVHESVIKGNDVATLVGCSRQDRNLMSHPDEVLECLRSKTANELALATSEVLAPKEFTFFPTFHDQFLPKPPAVAINHGFFQNVDTLVAVTSDECTDLLLIPPTFRTLSGSTQDIDNEVLELGMRELVASWAKSNFSGMMDEYIGTVPVGEKEDLRRAYIDYMSDRIFNCPVQFSAEKHAARGNAVYVLIFNHRSKVDGFPAWMGAPHHSTGRYIFARPFSDTAKFTEEDRIVSRDIIRILSSFAKDGTPILPNGAKYPMFTKESPTSVIVAANNFTEIRGFRGEECARWRNVL